VVRRSIIWLHGLGADGHDFEPVVPMLGVQQELGIRFVFPHAPQRAVTINQGYVMRAWFDIRRPAIDEDLDAEGIFTSDQQLQALIGREIERGIRAENILLAGFSQGGAIALHTALRYPHRLAGVLALSTFLPLVGDLEKQRNTAHNDLPIFMAHGEHDDIVPLAAAIRSRRLLEEMGYTVEWHSYAMGHSVSEDEIADIGAWIKKVMGE
jgi:phospholipase/carboxylesterase